MTALMETPNTATSKPSHADIAAQAYALWQQDGCRPGRDLEHWLRAEALLKRDSVAAPPSLLPTNPQPAIAVARKGRKPSPPRRAPNRPRLA